MSRKLIAILRGVKPDEAVAVAAAVLDAGIEVIEVPLNSPHPLHSIEAMVKAHGHRGRFGAGTVLSVREVGEVRDAGGTLIVSPNCDPAVIRATKAAGMASFPGVFTPTECFQALAAGADALKVFPGTMMGTAGLRAIRAVLPPETQVYVVGGAEPNSFGEWRAASADGFGLGSSLYRPGMAADEVGRRARLAVEAWDAVYSGRVTA